MSKRIDRRTFVKTAAAGSVAVAALPLLGTSIALAGEGDDDDGGSRIYVFVSFSHAPAALGITPRIGMQGAGTFRPAAGRVNGGGSYTLDNLAAPIPRPALASGRWRARHFVSYDTRGLASYGTIQPGILKMTADFEGIGKGLTLTVVCNVGAAGPAGSTGEEEGWDLEGTPYGTFEPLSPVVGISHLSIEGFRIGGD